MKIDKKIIIIASFLLIVLGIIGLLLINKTKKYTIVFISDGNEEIVKLKKGSLLENRIPEEKDDYTFIGWFYNDELFDFSKPINSNIILEAKWENDLTYYGDGKCVVDFDSDGGTIINSIELKCGEILDKQKIQEEVEKDGYKFVEWQLDNKTYNFKFKVTKNITLKAVWKEDIKKEYIISYDTDGGTSNNKQMVLEGERGLSPLAPTKMGYVFVEWQTDGAVYDFSDEVVSDVSLKAVWKKVSNSNIAVSFNSNGGTVVSTVFIKSGEKVSKPKNPTKDGYTFIEWQTENDGITYDFNKTVSSDTKLKAIWKANEYYINYYIGNNKKSLGESTHIYDKTSKIIKFDKLKASAPEGWEFAGWSTKPNGKKVEYNDAASVKKLTKKLNDKINLYAIFKRTIRFNSGVNNSSRVTKIQYYNPYDQTKGLTSVERVEPAYIKGWTAVGYGSDKNTKKTSFRNKTVKISATEKNTSTTVDLYAIYRRTLTINYYGNNATGGSMEPTTKIIYLNSGSTNTTSSQEVTLANNEFEKYNDTFEKWSGVQKGSKTYNPNLKYNSKTFEVTLNAEWSNKLDYVIVSFDSDGGSCINSQIINTGDKASKPKDPTKPGYKFEGWQYKGEIYDFGSKVTNNITLKANWTPLSYLVKLFTDYGLNEFNYIKIEAKYGQGMPSTGKKEENQKVFSSDYIPNSNKKVDYRNIVINLSEYVPTKPGKILAGWSTSAGVLYYNADFTSAKLFDKTAHGLALYPVWKNENQSVVFFDSDGGSSIIFQRIGIGENVIKPDNPTKTGYEFVEWQLDNKKFDFNTSIDKDTILKAIWKPIYSVKLFEDYGLNKYNYIKLEAGYGQEMPSTGKIEENQEVFSSNYIPDGNKEIKNRNMVINLSEYVPKKPGKIFAGYITSSGVLYYNDNLSCARIFDETKHGIAIYPKWVGYKVEFDSDGGNTVGIQTVLKNNKAKEPNTPFRPGYVFVEWQLDNKKFNFNTSIDKDTTLKAIWEPQVLLDGEGVVGDIEINITKTSTLSVYNPTNQKVTYKSNDEDIFTINEKGKITPKKNGTSTITIKIGDNEVIERNVRIITSILFIGNSKTMRSNLHNRFKEFSEVAGKNVIIKSILKGGESLEGHYCTIDSSNKEIGFVDYVIMQDDNTASEDSTSKAVSDIVNYIKKGTNKNVRVVLYAVWTTGTQLTTEEHKFSDARYSAAAEKLKNTDVKIVWAANVLSKYFDDNPEINKKDWLYDDRHPTYNATYLVLCSLYNGIFEKSKGIEYTYPAIKNGYGEIVDDYNKKNKYYYVETVKDAEKLVVPESLINEYKKIILINENKKIILINEKIKITLINKELANKLQEYADNYWDKTFEDMGYDKK